MPTTTPFNNLITFSRGSNATVTGSNGLIQWAPNNMMGSSESIDSSAWTKDNSVVYANQDFATGTVGPELVVNGNFATDSNWVKGVGWTISGGAAVATAVASFEQIFQNIGVVAGRTYRVSVTATVTSGSFSIGLGNSGQNIWVTQTASGTYASIVTVVTGTGSGNVYARGNPTFTGTIDNISVREITVLAATAPDGTNTADTWVPTVSGTTASARLLGTTSVPVGPVATASVYVKSTGKRWVYMTTPAASSPQHDCWFDLQTGTVGTQRPAVLSATITPVGNGWYRLTTTAVTVAVFNYIFLSTPDADANNVVTADGGGLLVWGAQLELGSTATTYNSTTVKNLLGFSEAFDNAAWTETGASIVTGAQANPINGLFNAQKLMEDTSTGDHRTFQAASVTNGTPYVFSAYVKPAGRTLVNLTSVSGALMNVTFDVSTGVITSTTNGVGSIVSVGSGWYRIAVTATATSTASANFQIRLLNNVPALSYTGDGNSGVYIYGAQLSDSASLDPYVPTPGAAPSSTAFYGPRFDFDPVTRAPRGLLVEEQRTNLLTYSDDFGNAAWNKSAATVTTNTAVAPDGTMTADTATMTSASYSSVFATVTVTAGISYTTSVYAKAGTVDVFSMEFRGSSTSPDVVFNLSNGTVTSGSGTITAVGNGWYRCSITKTSVDTSEIVIFGTGVVSALGSVLLWGAQLEAGAFATSYIPTVASTVTRSADVATISGSLFSQWYRQDEGAIAVDFVSPVAGDRTAVNPSDGTNNNRMTIGFTASSPNNLAVFTGGALQALIGAGAQTPGSISKMASAYRLNDFASTTNGAVPGTDTSGTVPTVNQLNIGSLAIGGALNGHIRSINFIPARAADFQLQAITTQPIVDYFFLQTATGDQLVDGNGDYLYSLPIFG